MNVVKKLFTDGTNEEGNWKMGLDEMQKFVGGYIEMVRSVITLRDQLYP